jgi:carbonic anhydrase
MDLTAYAFSSQPGFVETETRELFKTAVALRTIVIYCYDPRAVKIPNAVANAIPGEVFPGEIVRDTAGKKVASTATVFPVVVAGGRAVDALRSITVAQHLFGVENIVVVHHTYCGATSFTPQGLIDAFRREQGVDISTLYDARSVAIRDYESSLEHDVQIIRNSPGTPRRAKIYGYLFDIDTEGLTLIAQDLAVSGDL